MYGQWLFDIFIFFLAIAFIVLAMVFVMCLVRSIRHCSQCVLKAFAFFLTISSCLLLMIFVMGIVGLVMMGLYAVGSLLFTGHVDGLTALYVAVDTAFILGGGLAVIATLLCYSDVYDWFNRYVCNNQACNNQHSNLWDDLVCDLNSSHKCNSV
jgi:hypothetical protein